ncbi:MAG TPA: tail fiber protein, partial [Bacteroidia bacterium]|nr:tail fiber protein [Bacteroidia bacterium]
MKSNIFKTFFLSLCIIVNTTFAYAQTAAILPPAYTTFLDANGHPLTAGQVFFYIPSTTTPKTTWQDAAETIPNTNPVILDAAGKALILGSGSYRQIVQDQLGNTIWDQVTASPGGSGGGGGTATGDGDLVGTIKPWGGPTAPNQYMFTYGQQISRTTFAALFSAITSVQAIFCNTGSPTLSGLSDTTNFWIGMTVEVSCVSGGVTTVISKTSSTVNLAANANITTSTNATFFMWGNGNGVTTFTLPDFRGFNLAGNCLMGGVACSNLTTSNFGSQTPNGSGAAGGNATQTLQQINLPNVNLTTNITDPGHTHTVTSLLFNTRSNGTGASFGYYTNTGSAGGIITNTATTGITASTPLGGTATPFSIIQPTKTVNYIIKVTPDVNSAIASGVTSFGLMTGSIACGSGLVCTGNNVSVNVTSVSLTVGSSQVLSGTNNGVLWDNAGILSATTTLPTGLTAPAFTITGS